MHGITCTMAVKILAAHITATDGGLPARLCGDRRSRLRRRRETVTGQRA
jgi:hypothetical protein